MFKPQTAKAITGSSIILSLIIAMTLTACSKEAKTSQPNFVFKAPAKAASKKENNVVAKIGKREITYSELAKGVEGEIFQAESKLYELKFNRLKALILESLINADPKKGKLSNDEFLEQVIAKDVKVSDEDINKFVAEKNIPKQHLNDQFKGRIRSFLEVELKRKAIDNWMGEKTKNTVVEVYLQRPQRPWFDVNVGDSPTLGSKDAKITIVEYSDFQCPYCGRATETVKQLMEKYGKKVRLVFKHFPMPFHNEAQLAAEASLCAKEQKVDYFWKMHDELFKDQTKLGKSDLKATAKKLGLDTGKFDSCLDARKYQAAVKQEMKEAEEIGVKATPTFFVNGRLINGAQPIEAFSEVIDQELQAKK